MSAERMHTIYIRALNHLRKEHIPSYVGLRLLLDSFESNEKRDSIIFNYITKYGLTKKEPYYKRFNIFKEMKCGEHIYRECLSPSPTTALVESYILDKISKESSLEQKSYVYSYQYSHKNSGNNYQYYYDGYAKRNLDIQKALNSDEDNIAILLDIKKFYPSINQQKALSSFIEKVKCSTMSERDKKNISSALESMFLNHEGLPIGPALSHIIANYALTSVDEACSSIFGENYFRYVDDIAIVTNKKNAESCINKIDSLMSECGLKINEDKTQYVILSDWEKEIFSDKYLREDLSSFWSTIYLKILLDGDISEYIKERFVENGFSIPFSPMKMKSKNPLLVRYYNYYFKYKSTWKEKIYKNIKSRDNIFFDYAKSIRERVLNEFFKLTKIDCHTQYDNKKKSMAIKYLLGRLLYLTSTEIYPDIEAALPRTGEYYAQSCVIKDIITNSIENTINLPGSSVLTLSQILQAQSKIPCAGGSEYNRIQMESLNTLNLLGTLNPSCDLLSFAADDMYNSFCFNIDYKNYEKTCFDYDNEIYSLRKQQGKLSISDLINTRFDDNERIVFDGFNLGYSPYGLGY